MPCQNGATCINLQDRYVCLCNSGFNGVNCQQVLNPCGNTSCLNGATCNQIAGMFDFNCTCAPGFTGKYCEQLEDYCATRPCKNGAVCIKAMGSYVCNCLAGFTGFE